MKVSTGWLKELVDLEIPREKLASLFSLKTQGGVKEVGEGYIELDLKGYNRADLLSLRGIAYEVSAITGSKVKFGESEPQFGNLPEIPVEVEDKKLCPIYCLARIEGLKVGPSNQEWIKKLEDSGFRTVNNVADITNLVMLEYGQPLHAFDAGAVKDKIVVRKARDGEKITTLDNKTRNLQGDLLIADPEKGLGIAGVMGGKNSEVSDKTTAILLEAAIFDPKSLRQTSQRLGLTSEASKRFYHGLTKKRLLQAFDAAIKEYQKMGGKLTALTITGDFEDKTTTVNLSLEKVNKLIGVGITAEQVEQYLSLLNFKLTKTSQGFTVTPPLWRLDINIEEDVVEEVARMYGYENIPAKPLEGELPAKIDQTLFESISKIKRALCDLGLIEVQSYSFYSTQIINSLQLKVGSLVKIENPISAETEYMRQSIWPNLVEVVSKNIRQGFSDIAIFEIGKRYEMKGQPEEGYSIAIAFTNGTGSPVLELNQIVEKLNEMMDFGLKIEQSKAPDAVSGIFHPTRLYTVIRDGKQVGRMAEVHPRVLYKLGINRRVAVFEIQDI